MAKKTNAKLELLGRGIPAREICRTRHVSRQNIKKVREATEAKDVTRESFTGT